MKDATLLHRVALKRVRRLMWKHRQELVDILLLSVRALIKFIGN